MSDSSNTLPIVLKEALEAVRKQLVELKGKHLTLLMSKDEKDEVVLDAYAKELAELEKKEKDLETEIKAVAAALDVAAQTTAFFKEELASVATKREELEKKLIETEFELEDLAELMDAGCKAEERKLRINQKLLQQQIAKLDAKEAEFQTKVEAALALPLSPFKTPKARQGHKENAALQSVRGFLGKITLTLVDRFSAIINPAKKASLVTFGEVITARDTKKAWDGKTQEEKDNKKALQTTLRAFFTQEEWTHLEELNNLINKDAHLHTLPSSTSGVFELVVPARLADKQLLTTIATKAAIVGTCKDGVTRTLYVNSTADDSPPRNH